MSRSSLSDVTLLGVEIDETVPGMPMDVDVGKDEFCGPSVSTSLLPWVSANPTTPTPLEAIRPPAKKNQTGINIVNWEHFS